jgi:hypothetical protein
MEGKEETANQILSAFERKEITAAEAVDRLVKEADADRADAEEMVAIADGESDVIEI